MSSEIGSRVRFGEAFWRAHHEAWQQSALNQRQYCEAHGIPLKAFANWRARSASLANLARGAQIPIEPVGHHHRYPHHSFLSWRLSNAGRPSLWHRSAAAGIRNRSQ